MITSVCLICRRGENSPISFRLMEAISSFFKPSGKKTAMSISLNGVVLFFAREPKR